MSDSLEREGNRLNGRFYILSLVSPFSNTNFGQAITASAIPHSTLSVVADEAGFPYSVGTLARLPRDQSARVFVVTIRDSYSVRKAVLSRRHAESRFTAARNPLTHKALHHHHIDAIREAWHEADKC